MKFFSDRFGGEEPIRGYDDFWAWFTKNERRFYAAVKANDNVTQNVFDKISPKLAETTVQVIDVRCGAKKN